MNYHARGPVADAVQDASPQVTAMIAKIAKDKLRYRILYAAAPDQPRRPRVAAENPGHLALGGRHRRRLAPHQRARLRSLTSTFVPVPTTAPPGAVEPPATRPTVTTSS